MLFGPPVGRLFKTLPVTLTCLLLVLVGMSMGNGPSGTKITCDGQGNYPRLMGIVMDMSNYLQNLMGMDAGTAVRYGCSSTHRILYLCAHTHICINIYHYHYIYNYNIKKLNK